ncbi:hypothetical protein [Arsenicibacter rosenii]|uniref:Glycosyl transferase n=1 Tax=Arsenicibacter rosenii TaxID=1750698 RepID=A0A1S2VRF1_9BACT|nr:hypothetical protein [Arsenicibacter rosenii]OIN60776.1 hypothetical protein BLX24_01365 [Arsenicibacter rosenii]
MFAVLTVCHTRQLPQAITLGKSIQKVTPGALFLIGLADKLPDGIAADSLPFTVIPASDLLPEAELAGLSAAYTPTEMAGALKPLFLQTCYERYPDRPTFVYADPNLCFFQSLDAISDQLTDATLLLTPYLINPPADSKFPDEKHLQNIGLYNSDFLALRRSDEATRFLTWWDSRVRTRAHINFCEGLCTDQIWLMHIPAFFDGVRIIHQPTWHAGLWNLHNRQLQLHSGQWQVNGQGPLFFANFKGLTNPDEGFFPYQNRLFVGKRPDIQQLMTSYNQQLQVNRQPALTGIPVYGRQPEPLILRGWRKGAVDSLRKLTAFIDTMPIPVLR